MNKLFESRVEGKTSKSMKFLSAANALKKSTLISTGTPLGKLVCSDCVCCRIPYVYLEGMFVENHFGLIVNVRIKQVNTQNCTCDLHQCTGTEPAAHWCAMQCVYI